MPLIDASRVDEILKDCLHTDEELAEGLPDDAMIVYGILHNYGFQPQRLETYRAEITTMLMNLPLPFRPMSVGGGDGWSFLNACQDANDEQWTGLHLAMEALFCLGIGLGLAEWTLPKEMWAALPGGMPYVVVKV